MSTPLSATKTERDPGVTWTEDIASKVGWLLEKRLERTLGARAYRNGCLHVGNISGFVTKFFQCSDQIHFIHISNVTSTFACDVITSNISVTFEM